MSLNLLGVFRIIVLRWQLWRQRRWYNCRHRITAIATAAAAVVINDITKFMGTLKKHLCISRLIQVDTYVRLLECVRACDCTNFVYTCGQKIVI